MSKRVLTLCAAACPQLAEHLRSQITRIVKADTRRQALVELESVTTDEKVWLEKVQKASDRAAAANSSKLAATTDANKLAATTDANKLENSYPRERHRSA
jgi:formate hydrogenlyase subunit 6/NADH:ubiquinone oxidoreductase subunit I